MPLTSAPGVAVDDLGSQTVKGYGVSCVLAKAGSCVLSTALEVVVVDLSFQTMKGYCVSSVFVEAESCVLSTARLSEASEVGAHGSGALELGNRVEKKAEIIPAIFDCFKPSNNGYLVRSQPVCIS